MMAAGSLSLWVTILSLLVAGLPLVAWSGAYLALPLVLRRDCPPWGVVGAGRKLLRDRVITGALLTGVWFAGVCVLALNLWITVSLGLSLGSSLFDLDTALLGRLLSPANPIFLPAVGAIALTLLESVRHSSLALLYLDARVRRDALDLEAQVGAIESKAKTGRPGRRGTAAGAGARVATLLLFLGGGLAAAAGLPRAARAQAEVLSSSSPADRFIDVANEVIDRGAEVDTELAERVLGELDATQEESLLPLTEALQADLQEGAIARAEARLSQAFAEMELLVESEKAEAREVDRLLQEVLARPEFQRETRAKLTGGDVEPEEEEVEKDTWLSRLFERFFDWLEELFRSDPKERNRPELDAPLLPANLAWLLWAALLTVVALGIGGAVVRALGARDEDLEDELGAITDAAAEEEAPAGPLYDALSRAPDAWLAEADALAAKGELREALRAAYLALLGILDRAGNIAYRSEQTNWDHVRKFDGPQVARKRFHELTSSFERAWYGFDDVRHQDYRTVREGALDLASLSPQPSTAAAGAPGEAL